MRPLELRLRNFRSFHGGNHTFDFRDRRLIGVVGPIGSGKSTILDAVTFALYGRTPRTGAATRSLIHQREDQGAVSLRFEVEGEVWEAVRQIRRIGSSQHALYRLPADEPGAEPEEKVLMEREVSSRTVELLGLDYEGFGRSVMLAQGQFAQFLSARPAERDRVLKGVFGYERVSAIRDLARDAVRHAEHEIEKLRIHLEHAEAAKDRLHQRRADLAEAASRIETLEAARPSFEEFTRRIDRADERRERAEGRLAELAARSAELPDPEAGERICSAVEKARVRTSGAEFELRKSVGDLEDSEAALESDRFEQAMHGLEETKAALARSEADRDRIESRFADLRDGEAELPDRVRGIQTAVLVENASRCRVEASKELEGAVSRLGGAEAAAGSDEFARRQKRVITAGGLLVRLQTRTESAERAIRGTGRIGEALRSDEALEEEARATLTTAVSDRASAGEIARAAVARLSEAEDRLQEARHADMAGTLRHQLESGDTCPVCERPVHHVPPVSVGDTVAAQGAVNRARAERDGAEERLRTAVGAEQAAEAALVAAEERLAASRLRVDEARAEATRLASQIDECLRELARLLGEGDPAVRLEEERAALEALRVAAREARNLRDEKQAALDEAAQEERKAVEALSDLRTRIGTFGSRLDADFEAPDADPDGIRAALARLHSQWRRAVADLRGALREEQGKIDAASARRAGLQAVVDAFGTAAAEARARRDAALRVRDEATAAQQRAEDRLAELRLQVGRLGAFLNADFEVRAELDAVRAALASLHAGWSCASADLKRTAEEQRAERDAAALRLDGERARLEVEGSIEAALAEVRARRDQIAADIAREQELVAGVVGLVEERRKRQVEVDLNQRLVEDLTNARFVRFLLDEERAVLAGLGSEHFERLSSGRYRFTDDGKFGVVDLNYAEADRRAGSLSGGETFLASLSLALGLAEMVGRRGGRLDAFFLDEGFGTLDPEHLDLAMEGIESLVADREQRLVVVVSHVPELQERLEDLIRLDKDPLTGNSIVVSGGAA